MATKNFTQFNTASPLTTSDYIVGYNAAGTAEIKTQIQSIVNLVGDSDQQTLSFNEGNKSLSISSGNTVSLSALVDSSIDTGVRALTSNWEGTYTTVQTNSASWGIDSTVDTGVRELTGNWQSTYTTVQSNSSTWSNGLPSTGGTITGNLVVTQNLTADKVALADSYLDIGTLTNTVSTLYMSINGQLYGIPLIKLPLVPASADDNAAAAAYDDGLGNGDNGGSGFGAWEVTSDVGSGGYAGTYVSSSTDQGFGDINTSGEAFGLYAGGIGSGAYVECIRPLLSPLTVGNALSATIATAYRSGEKGVSLFDQADEELYAFTVAGDEYKINDTNLGWSYSQTSVFNLVAKQIDVNTINVTLTRGSDVDSRNVTGVVAKISFFNNGTNSGDLENLRFNSLKAYPYQ